MSSSPIHLIFTILALFLTLTLSQTLSRRDNVLHKHKLRGFSADDERWTGGRGRQRYDDDERPIWAVSRQYIDVTDTTDAPPPLFNGRLNNKVDVTDRIFNARKRYAIADDDKGALKDLSRRIRNRVVQKINNAMGNKVVAVDAPATIAEPLKRIDDDEHWRGTQKDRRRSDDDEKWRTGRDDDQCRCFKAPCKCPGFPILHDNDDDDQRWKARPSNRDDDEKWRAGRDDDDEKWRIGRDDDDEKWRIGRDDDEKWRMSATDDDQCVCVRAPCNCPGFLKNPLTWKAPRDDEQRMERLPFFDDDQFLRRVVSRPNDDDEFLRRVVSGIADDDEFLRRVVSRNVGNNDEFLRRVVYDDDDEEDPFEGVDEFFNFITTPYRYIKDKIQNPKKKREPDAPVKETTESEDQGNYCPMPDDDDDSDTRVRC